MGRLVLAGIGVAAGVFATVKAVRLAQAASPQDGEGWSASVRSFAADVRAGMAEREDDLRIALGVDTGTIDEATARDLLENPTRPRS
ncbi:hypothetical protein [Quadrisphaera sp. INWT6]|uniref:hypothetical protein n=1 Tax=Quadrisphaera sp. INWT6 TaxID=2596917 RepID=UPI0018923448|nr:hypothetical protein [Quadrisphaera sp. INWT6]MBF5083697.1 hypothetical protein [Quadrisphaera sp. INWT6]